MAWSTIEGYFLEKKNSLYFWTLSFLE